MSTTVLTAFYRPPHGLPLNWQDEISGCLHAAIHAYLDHQAKGTPFSTHQLKLLRGYLEYWINAPCWQGEGIQGLRYEVTKLETAQQIADWIWKCMEEGIDPL